MRYATMRFFGGVAHYRLILNFLININFSSGAFDICLCLLAVEPAAREYRGDGRCGHPY